MSDTAYEVAKRLLDVAGSAAGLLVTAPVLAGTAIAIRATTGGPIFFRQERPGREAKPFTLLKFRTMREPLPGEGEGASDAARLTKVGRLLRASSIDELPTLLNVLRGEMSLVGPRPLLMRYLPRYSREQFRRHEVKPGVTGWAQINGRNAIGWDEKFALDVWYVDHRSLALDLRILAMTVAKVLRREGISHAGEATMTEFMGSEPRSNEDADG
jgi:lipopolysaccharide/colanic/teichoic acid biosynthesis glycosyltransferase